MISEFFERQIEAERHRAAAQPGRDGPLHGRRAASAAQPAPEAPGQWVMQQQQHGARLHG